MDYSPSPSKVKPQYAFLDNSIEIGRGGYESRYATKVGSPLKPVKDTETLHERQRRFYSKYNDLDGSPETKRNLGSRADSGSTTPSRLFKNFDGKDVLLNDDVKISSNMIEKIIRENENLKIQLREQKREKELINGFATGLKEKLIKYKKLNDGLKLDVQNLERQNVILTKQKEALEKIQDNEKEAVEPKFNFDHEDVRDVFNQSKEEEEREMEPTPDNDSKISPRIEEKINELEAEILKINDKQESRFDYIKNEIEFLKQLSLQLKEPSKSEPSTTTAPSSSSSAPASKDIKTTPTEDDQIIRESEELIMLQKQVDNFNKKLQIREENKRRKHELNEELNRLTLQLQKEDLPAQNTSFTSESTTTDASSRTPLKETNTNFVKFKESLKNQCKACDQGTTTPEAQQEQEPQPDLERPCVTIDGARWYQ